MELPLEEILNEISRLRKLQAALRTDLTEIHKHLSYTMRITLLEQETLRQVAQVVQAARAEAPTNTRASDHDPVSGFEPGLLS